MKLEINTKVAAFIFCSVAAANVMPALAQGPQPGTEQTPVLGQTSYIMKSRRFGGLVTEYVSPIGIRREYEPGGSISIWDFRTGQTHFLNPITHRDMVQQGKPLVGKPRYYDSMRWLKKVGTCSYLGESGNLWSRPAFGYADAEKACITADGIILTTIDAGREQTVPLELKRESIPDSMFDVPAGFVR